MRHGRLTIDVSQVGATGKAGGRFHSNCMKIVILTKIYPILVSNIRHKCLRLRNTLISAAITNEISSLPH